jgi:hypothetical protein
MQMTSQLTLSRCPHCQIAHPTLEEVGRHSTNNHTHENPRTWIVYNCSTCGGLVTAWAYHIGHPVMEFFPESPTVDDEIPDRPKAYLQQALESLHAPAGAIMLCASAIDAMLKIKGYDSGSLYERIDTAANDHLITQEMARWAHEVRLDANDQRHADEDADLPTPEDAKVGIDFVTAFAQYLFVLPSRTSQGIQRAESDNG